MVARVPVVALTGYLGAGKTTVLNHLLQHPGLRAGVVINDFGAINVDAALITGQVDEAASIAGGCVCCLGDDTGLDDALERLSRPQLGIDVIIVEASGVAEPAALATLIRHSTAGRTRPGGLVEVVDAVEYFATVDTADPPPARFAAASLVVLNKCDRLDGPDRESRLERIEARVRRSNPQVHCVRADRGRIDPALLFDVASQDDPEDQLPFAAVAREASGYSSHQHAAAATARSPGPVDPGRLVDLLEDPPPGAYRMKGVVTVRSGPATRSYVVNVVGRSVHVAPAAAPPPQSHLVAIGMSLDADEARSRLEVALQPTDSPSAAGLQRLQRHRRLSA